MNKDLFKQDLREMGIIFNEEQLLKLELYYSELIEYNKHTNLTAIKEEKEVYYKHFYDSLTLIKAIDLNNISSLLDIGSGAGFPGVVLKIFYPDIKITLIDSNNKKTNFLKYIIDKLKLEKIDVIYGRVEQYSKDNLNKFDLVTARAVGNLTVLSELALPPVKKDGYFVAMKGHAFEEIKNSLFAIEYMDGKVFKEISFELPYGYGDRTLICIKKIKETNNSKLRPYDKIVKKPLQKRDK